MKTYEQIEKELLEIQESCRHPKPELGVLPAPDGQIAAQSVQFLLKELEREIELRDHAGDAAERAQRAVPVPRETHDRALQRIKHLEESTEIMQQEAFKMQKAIARLRDKAAMKEHLITDLKGQLTVNRCAALAMFQKIKSAAHIARNGTGLQAARYLLDAVNFHLNGVVEEVKRLNAEQEREEHGQDQDHQHITDGEEPR